MESALDNQDKHGSMNLNPVNIPNSRLCMSSTNGLHLKEMRTCGEEHTLKVRKPYTITKQRERWTEEEHNKFLEALTLYGRAWRRIEEHIGTKTAVQIRSHAQKFFSKVVRDSSGNSSGTVTPIEIPPPRPKRKPMHPYPRKLGNLSSKGVPIMLQKERLPSPSSASDQENGSPTSVLSGIGSSFSNFPVNCTSPISSAAGSNPLGALAIEKESEEQLQSMSAGGDQPLPQGTTAMEQDAGCDSNASSNEDSPVAANAPTIKLFGCTVLVTDSQKLSLSTIESEVSCYDSLTTGDIESNNRKMDMDVKTMCQGDSSQVLGQGAWNTWPGVPPMFCCTPLGGNFVGSAKTPSFPMPSWAFYGGGLPLPFIHLGNMISTQCAPHTCTGADDKEQQMEGSLTGANTTSVHETGAIDKSSDIVDMQSAASSLVLSENSAFRSWKADSDRPMKGFIPYKRCVAARELEHSQMASEEEEGRRIQLCL